MTVLSVAKSIASVSEHLSQPQLHPIRKLLAFRKTYRRHDQLISIHESATLAEALGIMARANISAVPVYRTPEDDIHGREYMGIVSVSDVLAWTVFQKFVGDLEYLDTVDPQTFQELQEEKAHYFQTAVGDLLGMTLESAESWTLHSSDPILSLIYMFASGRYHRCLVIDEDAKISAATYGDGTARVPLGAAVTMVTQTDVVRYISENRVEIDGEAIDKILSSVVAKDIEQLQRRMTPDESDPNQVLDKQNRVPRKVIYASSDMSALSAFKTMFMHRLRALPVVNPAHQIVANISTSDLRGITPDTLHRLTLPILEFIDTIPARSSGDAATHPGSGSGSGSGLDARAVSVAKNMSMEDMIQMLLGKNVHRLWVTRDQSDQLAGVVSMTDILCTLIPVDQAAHK
ncbi:uncharacterized protein BJ171DRAFT_433472 [Polychytrium aggregatum]|uniref:uncharacterized protein n=1 Tax=Polychytrium aggregatum TaxID=110093 RepID=UPI0022FEF2CA|nr:uncharacterized protein BJ171DRAFT_433472 [Polychytrium aggregatum]KAI9190809.1 hypothetical protein BJ171DRAFT_433472 [Polychytrium aggregatum]